MYDYIYCGITIKLNYCLQNRANLDKEMYQLWVYACIGELAEIL